MGNSLGRLYYPRDCNRVAHEIAKLVIRSPQNTVLFWDGTPPGVEELVAGDSAKKVKLRVLSEQWWRFHIGRIDVKHQLSYIIQGYCY
ncbi:hypothetical protein U9M48_010556 [Paspalum notatum var. saurae]|uniref:RNase H type-1 domain-containing protein n=1 Tax=Paspalum notatum var. saurae TaxID=547442 RepID=A0AAQ3SVB2_PASNO